MRECRGASQPGPESERGSLPMALLLIFVAMSMSALLAPLVVRQIVATGTVSNYARALQAAQAGIDAAMGQLRAATDVALVGQLDDLPPCDFAADLNAGTVLPPMAYRVTIDYHDADGDVMGCPPADVPITAWLVSTGTSRSSVRTVTGTYTFSTSNANISGGSIRISSPGTLCMDAGSDGSPPANQKVQMLTCVPGTGRQRFAYTPDLTLQLVDSATSAAPGGMCLDGGNPLAAGAFVTFMPCGNRLPQQQWSLDGVSVFHGTNDGITVENTCLTMASPNTLGSNVVLGGCTGNGSSNQFKADTSAGAGMSGPATGQLVNFEKFSQCVDVPNSAPTSGYLILWACKQSPNGIVEPNQRWFYPIPTAPADRATERIRTVKDTISYCMQSPQAPNVDIPTPTCDATAPVPAAMRWTVYGNTGEYATSYQIVDAAGYCLTYATRIRLAACNGSELQKWNADPNVTRPRPLTDLAEK